MLCESTFSAIWGASYTPPELAPMTHQRECAPIVRMLPGLLGPNPCHGGRKGCGLIDTAHVSLVEAGHKGSGRLVVDLP